ncbi:MAG: hypothetical protein QXW37_07530 [Candidatus Nitrosotenuis sp.]
MDDEARNFQIAEIAELLVNDNISLDEQDPKKLRKYINFAKAEFQLSNEDSTNLVNETFFYLKLKSAKDVDPLQDADKFGAGFS